MMTFKERAAVIFPKDLLSVDTKYMEEMNSTRNEKGDFIFFNLRKSTGKDQILSDDWNSISISCCRHCKKEITPYSENFFEYHPSLIDSFTLYCFENNYCRECAESLSKRNHASPKQVVKTSIQKLAGDRKPTEIKYFSDGSIEETNELFGERIKRNKR